MTEKRLDDVFLPQHPLGYWAATAILLGAALAGLQAALPAVIGLWVVQTLHFGFLGCA
jgi:hypothetical protein